MRLGIFGGTFNPPHVGHLIVCEHVRAELRLDRVLLVPASVPPHKPTKELVSSEHRLAMLELAIHGNNHFDISTVEIERGGVSYTVETLEYFKQLSNDELFLLIGMDNLIEFHSWRSPERILQLATVVVMSRAGFSSAAVPQALRDRVVICSVPEIEISSRQIRQRVREAKSIRYLVPDSVAEYIRQTGLYSL